MRPAPSTVATRGTAPGGYPARGRTVPDCVRTPVPARTRHGMASPPAPALHRVDGAAGDRHGYVRRAPAARASRPSRVRACFSPLRGPRDRGRELGLVGPGGLSTGMSGDHGIAVGEGATVVRVGQALFGARSLPDSHFWPGAAAAAATDTTREAL